MPGPWKLLSRPKSDPTPTLVAAWPAGRSPRVKIELYGNGGRGGGGVGGGGGRQEHRLALKAEF